MTVVPALLLAVSCDSCICSLIHSARASPNGERERDGQTRGRDTLMTWCLHPILRAFSHLPRRVCIYHQTCPSPGKVASMRLPAKGNSNFHGARPVNQIIPMIRWIRTSRFSIKNLRTGTRSEIELALRGACSLFTLLCSLSLSLSLSLCLALSRSL